MSDRPQGSVRTGSRGPDGADGEGTAALAQDGGVPSQGTGHQPATSTGTQAIPGSQAAPATGTQAIPSTGTQAIPTTGTQAVQTAGAPAAPSTGTQAVPTGSQRPVGAPAGRPAGAHPVPPPAVAPAGAAPAAGPGGPDGRRPGRTASRGPRRARLQLRHIDTWSALKISLVLSIALFFIWMVAIGVLYGVLNALGVFDTLNDLFGQIGSASGQEGGGDVVTPGLVFGGAAVIGAINIVLLTALCTVGTFIYNLCSDLVGGLELTLSERD
jgi:hypothetical protein